MTAIAVDQAQLLHEPTLLYFFSSAAALSSVQCSMFHLGTHGQGLTQIAELLLAFIFSSLIGLEREMKHKSAGLRTYAIVGTGAALFLLVSKYGFDDVLVPNHVILDPSRVAAQIVTGIGFIGAGLIFVENASVRGLTTAATVWLVSAIGMACGAGLLVLATVAVALYFIVALLYPRLLHLRPGRPSNAESSSRDEHD